MFQFDVPCRGCVCLYTCQIHMLSLVNLSVRVGIVKFFIYKFFIGQV